MKRKMISPNGLKANMVCSSCAHGKLISTPPPVYWRSRCFKHEKWIVDGGECCEDYEMEKFFMENGYKEIQIR